MTFEEIVADVQKRNAVRRAAGLPVLDEANEIARQMAVGRNCIFENAFAERRHEVVETWSDKNESWLTRATRWSDARGEARERFDRAANAEG